MEFNEFRSRDGSRELMVKFTCRRCGKEDIEPLEQHLTNDGYGYLHNLKCPEGWSVIHVHGPLLCPDCLAAYEQFMATGKEAKDE